MFFEELGVPDRPAEIKMYFFNPQPDLDNASVGKFGR